MPSSFLKLLTALLLTASPTATSAYPIANTPTLQVTRAAQVYCSGPPAKGCTNGMFNEETCECDCIPPFCKDSFGECNQPLNNCGGNPWQNCVEGADCPWWSTSANAETCMTGNNVPAGIWEIFPSNAHCCTQNFPYSQVCNVIKGTDAPTKYPTLAAVEEPEFEIIPIKFSVMGLPDDAKMRDLKNEMQDVLKRILTGLAEVFTDLKISKVEERAVIERNRNLKENSRSLAKDVDVYFDVYVVNTSGKKWGPLIIAELHDSYGDIMDQIQTYQGINYFSSNLELNWCTTLNGKYTDCSREAPKVTPTVMSAPPPDDSGGGFPGWAIAIIVIVILLIVGCIGYCIYASVKAEDDADTKNVNHIYNGGDDRTRRSARSRDYRDGRSTRSYRSDRSRSTRRSRRTKATRPNDDGGFQIVLRNPEEPTFGDDEFTINTYKNRPDPSMYPAQLGYNGNDAADRPDPPDVGSVLMLTNGGDDSMNSNKYTEDPPIKPKRDPTMYVDGTASIGYSQNGEDPSQYGRNVDPSMQYDQFNAEQPDGDVQRMQSMYMGNGGDEGSMQPDGDVQRFASMYMGGIDEESFQGNNFQNDNATQMSFRTQEPDEPLPPRREANHSYYSDSKSRVSTKSKKSTKSAKSKKSKKSHDESKAQSFRSEGNAKKPKGKDFVSSWGDIMGDMNDIDEEDPYEAQQKSKSFYR